jgi:flagellar basal-body rod protein FlgC
MSDAMQISRSALDVEWQRLQVIAENLANLNTSKTVSGEPFRPRRLISGPNVSFADALNRTRASDPTTVKVLGIEAMPSGVRRVYDPTDPQADAQGFVNMPQIDQAAEMTLMIRTSRTYEANLTALGIARQMFMKALDLGRSS